MTWHIAWLRYITLMTACLTCKRIQQKIIFMHGEEKYVSTQQEGILYAHASIWAVEGPQKHFLWIVYVQYQHLQAVFWSLMTCIGYYVPQTCSLRCRGISTMKVSLLYLRCRPWEDSLSFRKTVHRRQHGGWMFLSTNISRTFFEQEEKVSMIVFR